MHTYETVMAGKFGPKEKVQQRQIISTVTWIQKQMFFKLACFNGLNGLDLFSTKKLYPMQSPSKQADQKVLDVFCIVFKFKKGTISY